MVMTLGHVSSSALLLFVSPANQSLFMPSPQPSSFSVEDMKKDFHMLMKAKGKDHSWPSTTQVGAFNEWGATHWLFHCLQQSTPDCNAAWKTSLIGAAGQVVACSETSRLLLVLAVSSWTFITWELEIWPASDGKLFVPARNFSLDFCHVVQLESWLSIPCCPCLLSTRGPLGLQQCGEPQPLLLARIDEGLNLSVTQAKDLLAELGVSYKQARSRAALHDLLLDFYLETDAAKDAARKKMSSALLKHLAEDGDDSDSDYENLLEHLDQEGLHGDPDIKAEKEKLAARKKKKGLQELARNAKAVKAAAKAKAKAKAKGFKRRFAKAKAKAKFRPMKKAKASPKKMEAEDIGDMPGNASQLSL